MRQIRRIGDFSIESEEPGEKNDGHLSRMLRGTVRFPARKNNGENSRRLSVFAGSHPLCRGAAGKREPRAGREFQRVGGAFLRRLPKLSDRISFLVSSADQSSRDYEVTGPPYSEFDIEYEASAAYWELLD